MRIDLLAKNRFGYSYENMAAKRVVPLLQQQGLAVRVIYIEEGNFIQQMEDAPPDQILLFETPFEFASPGDYFRCPTFHWEAKELLAVSTALQSTYAKVGFLDPTISHPHVTFLPPGADTSPKAEGARPFDAIMFDELVEESELINYMRSCVGERAEEYEPVVRYIERSRVIWDLAAKFSHPLHLFGEHRGRELINRFPRTLSLHSLMGLHSELESFRLLSRAKILLIHLEGERLNRWIFPALFSGCLVLVNKTAYLEKLFQGVEGCFYSKGDWTMLEEKVRYYLHFPKEREKLLLQLQQLLQNEVSWKRRTLQLIDIMVKQC